MQALFFWLMRYLLTTGKKSFERFCTIAVESDVTRK